MILRIGSQRFFPERRRTGQFIVQVAGDSVRIRSDILKAMAAPDGLLRQTLLEIGDRLARVGRIVRSN